MTGQRRTLDRSGQAAAQLVLAASAHELRRMAEADGVETVHPDEHPLRNLLDLDASTDHVLVTATGERVDAADLLSACIALVNDACVALATTVQADPVVVARTWALDLAAAAYGDPEGPTT